MKCIGAASLYTCIKCAAFARNSGGKAFASFGSLPLSYSSLSTKPSPSVSTNSGLLPAIMVSMSSSSRSSSVSDSAGSVPSCASSQSLSPSESELSGGANSTRKKDLFAPPRSNSAIPAEPSEIRKSPKGCHESIANVWLACNRKRSPT